MKIPRNIIHSLHLFKETYICFHQLLQRTLKSPAKLPSVALFKLVNATVILVLNFCLILQYFISLSIDRASHIGVFTPGTRRLDVRGVLVTKLSSTSTSRSPFLGHVAAFLRPITALSFYLIQPLGLGLFVRSEATWGNK